MVTRSRAAIAIGTLIFGLVVGILIGFVLDKDQSSDNGARTPAPSVVGPGPSREVAGVPVGYARTEEGAVAAAANFTLLTARDPFLEVDALRAAMETLAAPDWKEDAREQAENGAQFILDRYGKDADVTGAVLRYELASFNPDRATVNLWAVSVASGSKRPTVDEVWSTLTVKLVWIGGDWHVEGSESASGPSPVDLPTSAPGDSAQFVMEEFNEFQGAPLP